jgi:hypothetical protein
MTDSDTTSARAKPEDPRVEIARTNTRIAMALREKNAAQAARESNMGRNGVTQFINRKTSITYQNMLALCDTLRVPIGIMHKKDAITESKLKLYELLERMPDHLAHQVLQEALRVSRDNR